jgi:1-phosphofructokinase
MIYTLTLHAAVDRILHVPGFPEGGLLRAELAALLAAGKGFNVSRNLAALGGESVACGLVGRGEEGFYRQSFGALGVETMLEAYDPPTRCNITVLDPQSGREVHLRERGPEVDRGCLERLADRLLERLGAGDLVAACGSLPRGIRPEDLGRFFAGARSRGAAVLLDSSGPGLEFRAGQGPDVLKVNCEELREMTGLLAGSPDGAVAAAREALSLGVGLVLVTLGANGAVAVSAEGAWHARGQGVEAVNTVGAGDAFNAGFLWRRGDGLETALRFAVACGAAQVSSRRIGLLKRAAVEELARGVETREV